MAEVGGEHGECGRRSTGRPWFGRAEGNSTRVIVSPPPDHPFAGIGSIEEGPVEADQRRQVEVLMEAMAAGDRSAPFSLYVEFHPHLATALRRHLRQAGALAVGRDDLDGLILDTCLLLFAAAPGWDCAGALPWTWAAPRLRALVARFVDQRGRPLDLVIDELAELPIPTTTGGGDPEADRDPLGLLHRLAAEDPVCRSLEAALDESGSLRDQVIVLEMRMQALAGDPSPAVTIARQLGMKPDAVRQVAHRMRVRLRATVAEHPRFRVLADLALLS